MALGGIYDVIPSPTLTSAKTAKSHQVLSHLAYPGMGACATPGGGLQAVAGHAGMFRASRARLFVPCRPQSSKPGKKRKRFPSPTPDWTRDRLVLLQ
jgi:hypothetical protein